MKRYECSLSTCHGDAAQIAGWDANFIVNLENSALFSVSSTVANNDFCPNDDLFPKNIAEPPEGLLIS